MRDGQSLFQMCEMLRGKHPDVLQLHHKSIEEQFIECKNECKKASILLKKGMCRERNLYRQHLNCCRRLLNKLAI